MPQRSQSHSSSAWMWAAIQAHVHCSAYTKSVHVCRGSFRALLLYDIAEEFNFDQLRRLLGAESPARSPGSNCRRPFMSALKPYAQWLDEA